MISEFQYHVPSRLHGRFQDAKGILGSSMVSLLGDLPVDDVPNVVDIGSLAIEVLITEQKESAEVTEWAIGYIGKRT